jgi:hypothetical protein
MTAVRSLLAPWIGGASAPQVTPGVRSMLAFWMGGAVIGAAIQPPAPPPVDYSGAFLWRPAADDSRQALREDEELLVIVSAALRLIV